MKSLSLFSLFILITTSGICQPVNATLNITSQPTTFNQNRGALAADQYLKAPRRTLNIPFKNVDSIGNLQVDPIDSAFAYYNGRQWRKLIYQTQLNAILGLYLPTASYAWSTLPGIPSTFPPAGHTHPISDITSLQSGLDQKLDISDTVGKFRPINWVPTFAQTLAKPTTAAGYGITDVYPLTGNPAGFISGINSGMVTAALSYTPVNPNGTIAQYIAGDGTKVTFPSIPAAQVKSDWTASSGVSEILNKPTIPVQVNIVAGQNTIVSGTYPNITVSDSSSVRMYSSSGRINQSVFKIWTGSVTPNTGNGYSIDISSAQFTTILSVAVSSETNVGSTTTMRNVELKSFTTTAAVVNAAVPNATNVSLVGLTLLGVPAFLGSGTGTKLHLTVIGY